GGGLLRLREVLPRTLAAELALTGEPMSAARLADLGVVNRVVPTGTALQAALDLARIISANAPLAVQEAKRVLMESADWSLAERFDRQRTIAETVRSSADAR